MSTGPDVTVVVPPADDSVRLSGCIESVPANIFAAWTDPAHLVRWRAPRGFTMMRCDVHLNPGGQWRHVFLGSDGDEYGVGGVFLSVASGRRLVYTECLDGLPAPATVALDLEPEAERTQLTMTLRYASSAQRDAHLRLGSVVAQRMILIDLNTYVRQRETCAA